MLTYPHFNPIAFHVGPLSVHWYGIMYLIGYMAAWGLALYRREKTTPPWSREEIDDLIFYAALFGIIGGRLGYMLFYDFQDFIHAPWIFFKVWEGGMSIHGGIIGLFVGIFFLSRKTKRLFWDVMDFTLPLAPIGLGLGRFGNFINGELWGRVTTMPWGMVFPQAGPLPRHPSQLYEIFLEGIVLFLILWFFSAKPRPRMAVSGVAVLCYGIFRIIAECFRQPDMQLGFIAFNWLTMGQLLSLPLVLLGIFLLTMAYRRKS